MKKRSSPKKHGYRKKIYLWMKRLILLLLLLSTSAILFKEPLLHLLSPYVSLPKTATIIAINDPNIVTSTVKNCEINRDLSTYSDLTQKENSRVAAWNIYKQQKPTWKRSLTELMESNAFILLQETRLTPDLKAFIKEKNWFFYQVNAFTLHQESYGVALLSRIKPVIVCVFLTPEPWALIPKSAFIAYFRGTNNQWFSLANIHSINFSVGLTEYREQLKMVTNHLKESDQITNIEEIPLIFAGDFNTWRLKREQLVQNIMAELNLREVTFKEDNRVQWMSYPLDHLFYRGITIKKSDVIVNDSSDHMAMQIQFNFTPTEQNPETLPYKQQSPD